MNSFKIISIVLLAFLVVSCNKEDEQATGVGDVFVISKKSGANDVHGISIFAYSYSSFKSVTALNTAESAKTYTLKPNLGYETTFFYETPDAEYTTTKPTASKFNFSAIFENGMTDEFQDELTDKILAIPVVDTCQYNPSKDYLRLTWQSVTGADSYSINILDGSTLVFGTTQFVNTVKAVSIPDHGIGWVAGYTPISGKTYKVRLFTYLYETQKTTYDIQSISFSENEVVWGD